VCEENDGLVRRVLGLKEADEVVCWPARRLEKLPRAREFLQSMALLDQAAFGAVLFHSIILAVNLDEAAV
jgi:hypothetical protein